MRNLNNFILKIQIFKTYLAKFILYNLSKLTFNIYNTSNKLALLNIYTIKAKYP